MRRVKELEVENGRLKKLVAEQVIDIWILKESNDDLGKRIARVSAGAQNRPRRGA